MSVLDGLSEDERGPVKCCDSCTHENCGQIMEVLSDVLDKEVRNICDCNCETAQKRRVDYELAESQRPTTEDENI